MKLIFTLITASILLLGCADSKENKSALANKENKNEINTQVDGKSQQSTRSVAQRYQVAHTDSGHVDCLLDVNNKQGETVSLNSEQHVLLALGDDRVVTVDDVIWLRVYPASNEETTCYVETVFLEPVADYSAESTENK